MAQLVPHRVTDRLPGQRLSAVLMAHQTPLPGLVCSAAPLAQSSPELTFTVIHSLNLSLTGLST